MARSRSKADEEKALKAEADTSFNPAEFDPAMKPAASAQVQQPSDQLIQQRALGDSRGFFHNDSGRPSTAKYIDLTILGLIGRRNAGVPNDMGGLTIHQATVLCHLPFLTNRVVAGSRFPNSVKTYTFCHAAPGSDVHHR